MAIRARLGIHTMDDWRAIPDSDREDWLVWQLWIERTVGELQRQLSDADTPEDQRKNNLTPEAAVLMTLARMGL